jgi:hypothetical protein
MDEILERADAAAADVLEINRKDHRALFAHDQQDARVRQRLGDPLGDRLAVGKHRIDLRPDQRFGGDHRH